MPSSLPIAKRIVVKAYCFFFLLLWYRCDLMMFSNYMHRRGYILCELHLIVTPKQSRPVGID